MSLNQLRLNNNPHLSGSIPDEIGALRFLERFELLDTNMSGVSADQPLPCFLQQSSLVFITPALMPEDSAASQALV